MKKLIILFILLVLCGSAEAYYTKGNYSYGTISANTLADAETTGDTFGVTLGTNSNDIPNGTALITVFGATCSQPSSCGTREIVKVSASSCSGTAPSRVCTLTIASSGRNQESTTHSGDWVEGSKAQLNLTIAQMTEYETAIDLRALYSGSATNVATATALASNPTDCSAGEYATSIAANGNLTCSNPISNIDWYFTLTHPSRVQGTNNLFDTTTTNATFGQSSFSASVAAASNYVEYRLIVPYDIDTSVDLVLKQFKFVLADAESNGLTQQYVISMASVANSASYGSSSLSNAIDLDWTADATYASGDVASIFDVTLTGWKAALTGGQLLVIRIARDGNDATYDTSTTATYSGPLTISYGRTLE